MITNFQEYIFFIITPLLVLSYIPVNRALRKEFSEFALLYIVSGMFRLCMITVAFIVGRPIDVAFCIMFMVAIEIQQVIKTDRKNRLMESVA